MYFLDEINKYKNTNIKLFVDMDGCIVDYEVNNAKDYDIKRPLLNNIKLLETISNKDNIELYILSITRYNEGYEQKQRWLDKYVPFIDKDHRIIISREANNMTKSPELKAKYLKQYKDSNDTIMLIDDDPRILEAVSDMVPNIILYKDTIFVD
jgi:5'(3')-deoxyribonucleotidase